jgi:hypothetical protein
MMNASFFIHYSSSIIHHYFWRNNHPARMHLFRLLLLFSVSGLLWTCQSAVTDPVPDDGAYFPLETGKAAIFDVTDVQYAIGATPKTTTYQLKETVGPAYTDLSGRTAYRLFRYRRSAAGQPWLADSVWSARREENRAIRTENGRDYVKIVFPVTNGAVWNGNLYNNTGTDQYELRQANQPYTMQGQAFDQTLTVLQQNDSTLVSLDKRLEVYARQSGLIYREKAQLFYCSSSPACIGKNQIDYGLRQTYRLRSYGPDQ